MVLKNKGHVGTLTGLVGVVALGVASILNVNCNRGRDYVSERIVERNEKDEAVDRLAKALGDRLEDRSMLYRLEVRDLVEYSQIFEGDESVKKIIFPNIDNRQAYEDSANKFNPLEVFGKEKLDEFERGFPGVNLIPDNYNYFGKEKDKLALLKCYLDSLEGQSVGVSLINY